MSQSTNLGQAAIDPAELPDPSPPSIPLWAENYVYEVMCPKAGAGFLLHLGRQPFNTDVWRDTFIADLGGEEVYLWKGFGKGAHARGPGGSQLKFSCEESFQRWTLTFDGAAQRVRRSQVTPGAGGSVRDGPIVPLRLRLNAVVDGPVWDLGKVVSAHAWGKSHYQQSMRIPDGEIIVDGKQLALEGVATRDHTRGPRDFNGLGSYAWIHGGFPGGRRFITLALDPRVGTDQPGIRDAIIGEGTELTSVQVLETSIPEQLDGGPSTFILRLKGPRGVETIEGERLSSVILGVGAPNLLMLGPSSDSATKGHMFCSPTRFRWNGETCYGFSERTVAVYPTTVGGKASVTAHPN